MFGAIFYKQKTIQIKYFFSNLFEATMQFKKFKTFLNKNRLKNFIDKPEF